MSVNSNIHVERYKAIKPFVTFKLDLRKKLTKSEKAKIRRYYNQLADKDTRFTQKYQPRNIKNVKVAQKAAGIKGSQWKAIPVRTVIKGQKISVVNGRLNFTGVIGNTRVYVIDQVELVTRPVREVLINHGVPQRLRADQEYQILTDQNPANGTFDDFDLLVEEIESYLIKYIPTDDVDRIDVALHTFASASNKDKKRFADNVLDSENVRKGKVKHRKKKRASRKLKSTKAVRR